MKKNDSVYRQKYYDLRAKYISDAEFSWKQGYEEGYQMAQQEAQQMQMEQAQQEQAMMEQQAMGEEEEGFGGAQGVAPEDAAQQAPGQPGAEGSEEDQLSADDQAMQASGVGGLTEPLPPIEGELGKNIDALMGMLSKGNKPKLTDLRHVVEKIDTLRKNQKDTVINLAKSELVNNVFDKWEVEDKIKEEKNAKV